MSDGKYNDREANVQDEFFGEDDADASLDTGTQHAVLTMRTIGAFPDAVKKTNATRVLCEIRGVITGLQEELDSDKKQVFIALTGEFRAFVYGDGGEVTEHYAPRCYLPTAWQKAAVDRCRREGISVRRLDSPDNEPHEPGIPFILEFAAAPASNPAGYTYLARSLMRSSARSTTMLDRLAAESRHVRSLLAKMRPALAAPVNGGDTVIDAEGAPEKSGSRR